MGTTLAIIAAYFVGMVIGAYIMFYQYDSKIKELRKDLIEIDQLIKTKWQEKIKDDLENTRTH